MVLKDVPVGRKLFIIYFAGVLIPLLIINALVLSRFQQTLKEQYRTGNAVFMDRALARVSSVIDNGHYVLQKFYSDRGIYRILDSDYASDREFVSIYNDLFNSTVLSFLPFYEDISSFLLFTTNPTILNGGNVRIVDDRIRGQEWYRFPEAFHSSFLISWVGSNQEDDRQDLHVSIVHPLNYYASYSRYYHFMKADLKLSSLALILRDLPEGADLHLIDGSGRIILSSDSRQSFLSVPKEDFWAWKGVYSLERILDNSGERPWRLMGVFPEKPTEPAILPGYWFLPLTGLILLLNSSFLIYRVSRSFTIRLNRLTGHIHNQESERMTILEETGGPGKDEIGELIDSFNQMSLRINQLVHDVYNSELAFRETVMVRQNAELQALQSQVNPHYLFNTLESIRMKSVLKGEDETAEILQYFSSSFRRMFSWGEDLVPLRESLRFLEEYLAIQRYRMGDRLSYHIHCSKILLSWPVPKLIIQPVVENSCRHGFKGEAGVYRLNIYLEKVEGALQVTVDDNGIGMNDTLVEDIRTVLASGEPADRFVGLQNVRSRLRARYGEELFQIISRPEAGTRVIFRIGSPEEGCL